MENVRISVVQQEPEEDAFAKVVLLAEKAGVTITPNVVSAYHRLLGEKL